MGFIKLVSRTRSHRRKLKSGKITWVRGHSNKINRKPRKRS